MFIIPTIIAFLYELLLAIPILGGAIMIGSGYSALTTALVIHVIVLVLRFVTGHSKVVPILAIILTLLTWIPILGWTIHILIAVAYFIDFFMGLGKSSIKRDF
ncbi:hypothetical protein MHH85_02385 [Viridibacillus sp. FSL E2-0187]|jgi:uncharacterized membrane protein|uniref:Uncharacterized protein n=1 Tax=Viridibacillus arvi TaxID=263475 RepID=A0A0M0LNF3_9BACL|nr:MULTISPECIES: hypothetical protein [Viridibacillus]KOO52521.1 hypothetical protein AMD00_09055 [Viridibacillus arvi]QOV13070.1 hypothetical protein JNUCC6_10080 [Viridibacillus sp. JNUCC-6]